ncbi:MAG: nucleotidyl transferase AbiEii/AbiGii toxin family protein [Deltaproteobacteria bacterium]|nr:nucleotidyl transferase AbiEii/AbiGii toxin family protein [Deltaproteobacteria bacterium]
MCPHRASRDDLDLFWQGRHRFEAEPDDATERLRACGLDVAVQQRSHAFCRLDVRDGQEQTTVDLVANPVPLAEPPIEVEVDGATIQVDTRHQILVNKLCALLSRNEIRDLQDVQVLLGSGGTLERALADAGQQDAGFSPLTFAWVLRGLPVAIMARALDWEAEPTRALEAFRDELVERVLALAVPP